DGRWKLRWGHQREQKRQGCIVLVVNDEVGLAYAVAELNDIERLAAHANAFVALCSKDERLAVFEYQLRVSFDVLLRQRGESAVVENVAVLQNLDEGGAAVLVGAAHDVLQVLGLDIDCPCNERSVGTKCNRKRIERVINRAERRRLGDF